MTRGNVYLARLLLLLLGAGLPWQEESAQAQAVLPPPLVASGVAPGTVAPRRRSASDESFSFAAAVGREYAQQAYGSEVYTLVEGAGSPPISAFVFPSASDDFEQCSVRFLVGTTTTAPVTVTPGTTVTAPSGATAVTVTLLDASGAQITAPGDFTFYLRFAADGPVTASVTGNEPPVGDTFVPVILPPGGNR